MCRGLGLGPLQGLRWFRGLGLGLGLFEASGVFFFFGNCLGFGFTLCGPCILGSAACAIPVNINLVYNVSTACVPSGVCVKPGFYHK